MKDGGEIVMQHWDTEPDGKKKNQILYLLHIYWPLQGLFLDMLHLRKRKKAGEE